jgi:hypothetical protein
LCKWSPIWLQTKNSFKKKKKHTHVFFGQSFFLCISDHERTNYYELVFFLFCENSFIHVNVSWLCNLIIKYHLNSDLLFSTQKSFSMSGTRTKKTLHFPAKNNNNKEEAWCWTKKLMLPFLTCSLYTSYTELGLVGVGSGRFPVDYSDPMKLHVLQLAWIERERESFITLARVPPNAIYLLDWNTTSQTFIAHCKIALEFEACKKREG